MLCGKGACDQFCRALTHHMIPDSLPKNTKLVLVSHKSELASSTAPTHVRGRDEWLVSHHLIPLHPLFQGRYFKVAPLHSSLQMSCLGTD